MKTQTLLNYGLAIIIVILLFYIRTSAEQQAEQPLVEPLSNPQATCKYSDINGFEPAREIDKAAAKSQTDAYKEFAAAQGNETLGGVISKEALDLLFCGGKYNGLAYQLAMDPKAAPGKEKVIFIVIGGVEVKEVNNVKEIVAQSDKFYGTNLWCPPSCMSFE